MKHEIGRDEIGHRAALVLKDGRLPIPQPEMMVVRQGGSKEKIDSSVPRSS
jgi:hypothetical protein